MPCFFFTMKPLLIWDNANFRKLRNAIIKKGKLNPQKVALRHELRFYAKEVIRDYPENGVDTHMRSLKRQLREKQVLDPRGLTYALEFACSLDDGLCHTLPLSLPRSGYYFWISSYDGLEIVWRIEKVASNKLIVLANEAQTAVEFYADDAFYIDRFFGKDRDYRKDLMDLLYVSPEGRRNAMKAYAKKFNKCCLCNDPVAFSVIRCKACIYNQGAS